MITKSIMRRAGVFAFAMTAVTAALLAATAGSSAATTAAVPPANAKAEVVTQFGGEVLWYLGLNGSNTVTLDLTGGRYRITDTAPITAGAGCLVAKADPGQFAVLCKAPTKTNGALQTVRFDLAGGNDVVTNRTAAPTRADGGDGNDTLNGGPANDPAHRHPRIGSVAGQRRQRFAVHRRSRRFRARCAGRRGRRRRPPRERGERPPARR